MPQRDFMAKLSAEARRKLPNKTFAGPDRSYPIPDKNHAKAALALIRHAPASAQPKIRARAHAMLGKADGGIVGRARSMFGGSARRQRSFNAGYAHSPSSGHRNVTFADGGAVFRKGHGLRRV
jgi:hypothetical protein